MTRDARLQKLLESGISVRRGNTLEAIQYFTDAIGLARAAGDRELYLKALGQRRMCFESLGSKEEAAADSRELFWAGKLHRSLSKPCGVS